jgi:hypothetical protein
MVIFESEDDLLAKLRQHDGLVRQCARGELPFEEFCGKYNDFYAFYALDGHESDNEERALLEKYEDRIESHRIIAIEILGQVCSDQDAQLEVYQRADRFGSAEAVERLRHVKLSAE